VGSVAALTATESSFASGLLTADGRSMAAPYSGAPRRPMGWDRKQPRRLGSLRDLAREREQLAANPAHGTGPQACFRSPYLMSRLTVVAPGPFPYRPPLVTPPLLACPAHDDSMAPASGGA
jgi:hypothetical protein